MPESTEPIFPVADLHCDLLSYMARIPGADWEDPEAIGVALPHLRAGGVKLQVMAIFTATKRGSTHKARLQAAQWNRIKDLEGIWPLPGADKEKELGTREEIGILAAIENASGLCEEEETLQNAWRNLAMLEEEVGPILYISLTHHDENRFGGGNYSNNVGLKKDGMALLDRLEGRNIAVDLSHTSDQLAEDILSYTLKQSLALPIMASHSNFRSVWNHVRNLPDEFAQEIIHRQGLIGINFLRSYIHDEEPAELFSHIHHAISLGAENALAFGADYFYTHDFHDPTRFPLYHPQHRTAACFPEVLQLLEDQGIGPSTLQKLAHGNVAEFLIRIGKGT